MGYEFMVDKIARIIGKEYTECLKVELVPLEVLEQFLVKYKPKFGDVCHAIWKEDEICCIAIFNANMKQLTNVIATNKYYRDNDWVIDFKSLLLKFKIGDMKGFDIRPPDYTRR